MNFPLLEAKSRSTYAFARGGNSVNLMLNDPPWSEY
jgi:hypothetical protein